MPPSSGTGGLGGLGLLVTMRSGATMELFMAGGNPPAVGVPLPNGFPEAAPAEIAAAK